MELMFDLQDVTDFIGRLGFYWDGTITSENSLTIRQANEKDLIPQKNESMKTLSLRVMDFKNKGKKSPLRIMVSNTDFKQEMYISIHDTYFMSISNQWQDFLLERHPETYPAVYIDVYMKKYNEILSKCPTKGLFSKKVIIPEQQQKELAEIKKKISHARYLQDQYSLAR